MKTALLAILLFAIMIFPHELGHFIAAKLCGIQVNEFAFGMGPVIWKKQRGETLHSIRLFPIGGFCAMEGEDGGAEDDTEPEYNERAFNNKKPWQKLIVLAAGSFMNVVCAFLVMALVICIVGFNTTYIGEVTSGSPAEKAGIMVNDEVIAVNGTEVSSWNDVGTLIRKSEGNEIVILVDRKGNTDNISFSITPEYSEESQSYVVGIISKKDHSPIKASVSALKSTYNMFGIMFDSLRMIFTGEAGVDEMSGPVGIVQLVGETSSYGLWYYGFLTALICVNLAVINMLPLPALDGGRIIFVLYSWITGKAVSPKVEGTVHAIGIVLLLGLMVFVTFNDITRLIRG